MKIVLNDEAIKNDYGFRILNAGIDLSRFENNPVVLFRHKDSELAIGTVKNIRVEGSQLVGEVEWDKEDEDPAVKRLIGKYERGVMKGFSGGLMVFEMLRTEQKNGEKDDLATRSEFYELSAVTIPSNKNAVALKLLNKNGTTIQLLSQGKKIELAFDNNKIDFSTIQKSEIVMEDMKKIAAALGLPDTATADEIVAAIKKIEKTTSDVKAELVSSVIKEGEANGIITDANREDIKVMLDSNFNAAKKFLASVGVVKAAETKNTEGGSAVTLKAILQSNSTAQTNTPVVVDPTNKDTWDYETWSKKDSQGLMQLSKNEKVKYNALLEAHRLKHA